MPYCVVLAYFRNFLEIFQMRYLHFINPLFTFVKQSTKSVEFIV
jgi:hypothetical protein